MSYREFHFNSSKLTQTVTRETIQSLGDQNHPIYELNEPIDLKRFSVLDAQFSLSFDSFTPKSSASVSDFKLIITNGTYIGYWLITIPKGPYTGKTFCNRIASVLSTNPAPYDTNGGAVPAARDVSLITWSISDYELETDPNRVGRLKAVATAGVMTGITNVWLEFDEEWASALSRGYSKFPLYSSGYPDVYSEFPFRTFPNYLYLHSNIMSGAGHASHSRAVGGYSAKTILAKIPIDFSLKPAQIQNWVNPAQVSQEFLFTAHGPVDRLEFWFTLEDGTEIDFNGYGFSLTISSLQ